eukprot:gene34369-41601_t
MKAENKKTRTATSLEAETAHESSIMGSAHAPAPIDYRVERCMKNFQVPQEKIEELWRLFTRYVRDGKGYMMADDFFVDVIKVRRTGLTDSMFTLVETKSATQVTFGEFVEIICTFSCFEQTELMRYLFYILDQHKTGLVEINEFKHFLLGLWDHNVLSNFNVAMDYLHQLDDGDGVLNFKEMCALQSKYPNVFYPIYQMQTLVMQNTFGLYWWETHKARMAEEKQAKKLEELAQLKKKQKAAAKAENVNEDMVKKRMGVRYYLMPWKRVQERNRIAKIAAIESELEKKTKLKL